MLHGEFSSDACAAGLDASPCEVLSVDLATGLVVGANQRTLDNVGVDFERLSGLGLKDLFCPETVEKIDSFLSDDGSSGAKVERFAGRKRRSGGDYYDVSMGLQLLSGPRPLLVTVSIDISRRLSAEREAEMARRMLEASIEVLPHGFVLYDRNDRLVVCNEQYRRFYPKSASAMTPGTAFEEILRLGLAEGEYLDAIGREDEWLQERLAKHASASETVFQRIAGGRTLQIIERPTPDGGRVGLRIDITQHVRSLERAERAEQRLLDAIGALPAGFWLFDEHDRLVMYNERFRDMYSESRDGLSVGRTFEEILRVGLKNGQYPDAVGREEAWLSEVMEKRRQDSYELVYRLYDGRWIQSLNERTSEGGTVGFRIDITESKQKQLELEKAAMTDSLTGLLNRRGVKESLDLIERRLGKDEEIQFLHIDLDKFKPINDVFGHQFGDNVLETIADILRKRIGAEDVIARVGGDEFLLLRAAGRGGEPALAFAERIRSALSKPIVLNGRVCHVSASIGVASWRLGDARSLDEALQDADIALNTAKQVGRNAVREFVPAMRAQSVSDARIAEDVVRGLKQDEFTAFFQPIVDVEDDSVTGFECLARWRHPEKGILPPQDFLSACEAAGVVASIDRAVLEEAASFARTLRDHRLSKLRISLNLSSSQLKQRGLVDQYLWVLASHGVEPGQFRIEILESTLLEDRASHVEENIRRFSEEGFLIDLDDFGTGHTAIASLRHFPVDRIKIDRSLVRDVDRDPELTILTDAVVSLGRRLGLRVLAEGVERQEEIDVIKAMGVTCAQGFLFSEPLSARDCMSWMSHGSKSTRHSGPVRDTA